MKLNKNVIFSVIAFSLFFSVNTVEAQSKSKIPQHLQKQVEKLTDLLSDGYAVGYPEGSMVQVFKTKFSELNLVIFTVEGFGGGNNHTQYLAIFEKNINQEDKPYYTLLDLISIAGKGWRGIEKLNAKITDNTKTGEMHIAIPALEVGPEDAPNFPTKKIVLNLIYKNGKLAEINK